MLSATAAASRVATDGTRSAIERVVAPAFAFAVPQRCLVVLVTTKDGGSGLGLSLALRALDLHHGNINVESEVGSGTVVTSRLPTVYHGDSLRSDKALE